MADIEKEQKRMKSYFVTISDAQKDKLHGEDIHAHDFSLERSDGEVDYGVVVSESELDRFLATLGLEKGEVSKTQYAGIFRLDYRISGAKITKYFSEALGGIVKPKKATVRVDSFNGTNREMFVEIARKVLVPVVGNVVITVPHGEPSPVSSSDSFVIRIWSTPFMDAYRDASVPVRIWGIYVDCTDNGYLPSGQGEVFVDDANGYAVAELVGKTLFIFHDVCHYGTSNEAAIFKKILTQAVEVLTLSPEEKEKRRKKREAEAAERFRREEEEKKKKTKKEYIDACRGRGEKMVEDIREKVVSGRENVEKWREKLIAEIRATVEAEKKLAWLESSLDYSNKKYGEEYDKLLSFPKVRGVVIKDDVLHVYTDKLYCVDPRTKKRREIGEFDIRIHLESGDIRWINLTRVISTPIHTGMHAPHVFQDGRACLGTMSEIIPDLVGNHEYAQLAIVCIQFVETVNTGDDAGRHVTAWPLAEGEARGEKKEKAKKGR